MLNAASVLTNSNNSEDDRVDWMTSTATTLCVFIRQSASHTDTYAAHTLHCNSFTVKTIPLQCLASHHISIHPLLFSFHSPAIILFRCMTHKWMHWSTDQCVVGLYKYDCSTVAQSHTIYKLNFTKCHWLWLALKKTNFRLQIASTVHLTKPVSLKLTV